MVTYGSKTKFKFVIFDLNIEVWHKVVKIWHIIRKNDTILQDWGHTEDTKTLLKTFHTWTITLSWWNLDTNVWLYQIQVWITSKAARYSLKIYVLTDALTAFVIRLITQQVNVWGEFLSKSEKNIKVVKEYSRPLKDSHNASTSSNHTIGKSRI